MTCPGFQPANADPNAEPANFATATDLEWHLNPECPHLFCGGCGQDDCHPGLCCTEEPDRLNALDSVCGLCPERRATGQVVAS